MRALLRLWLRFRLRIWSRRKERIDLCGTQGAATGRLDIAKLMFRALEPVLHRNLTALVLINTDDEIVAGLQKTQTILADIVLENKPVRTAAGIDNGVCASSCAVHIDVITSTTGKRIIARSAAKDVRVLVVGNPCNTNALIAMHNASGVPSDRFFAMTRLDENRAKSQLAEKAGVHVTEVTNMAIWGNHSSTQYPDFTNARIGGKPVTEVIKDTEWLKGDFITTVQQRGAAIIKARGASSAASAASAAVDTVRSLATQTPEGDWYSVAVCSDGSYGIEKGLICSFPVRTTKDGGWEIVQGLPVDAFSREKIDATVNELKEERDAVSSLLKH